MVMHYHEEGEVQPSAKDGNEPAREGDTESEIKQDESPLAVNQSVPPLSESSFFSQQHPSTLDSRLQTQRDLRDERRREFLSRLIRQDIEPLVVLSGGSGSGKSYLITLLAGEGVEQAERLISRPRRDSDPPEDVSWDQDNPRHQDENLLFHYLKYGHEYGYTFDSVGRAIAEGQPQAFIAGDVGKLFPFVKAIRDAFPGVPVITLRLEVPLKAMHHRLTNLRKEAFPGEADQRIKSNQAFREWEENQIKELKEFTDLHVVFNLSEEEHDRFGYSGTQIQALTGDVLSRLYTEFRNEAKKQSSYYAARLLESRDISHDRFMVPPALAEVFTTKLMPAAEKLGVRPLIKGGLAVALYLHSTPTADELDATELPMINSLDSLTEAMVPLHAPVRPVSLDIDWAFRQDETSIHLTLVQDLSDNDALEYKDAFDKPFFHSRKVSGGVSLESGQYVELDAISVSRVRQDENGFCFEFPIDPVVEFHRRQVNLPDGQAVSLVPPEYLVLEKFAAGRGANLDKMDLYDATALLVTQSLRVEILQRLIDIQKFDPAVDRKVTAFSERPELSEFASSLRGIGITDPHLVNIITDRLFTSFLQGEEVATDAGKSIEPVHSLPFDWSMDSLKRVALVDTLLRAIGKVEDTLHMPYSFGDLELKSYVELLGEDSVTRSLQSMKRFLYHYAAFQAGRKDIPDRTARDPLGEIF